MAGPAAVLVSLALLAFTTPSAGASVDFGQQCAKAVDVPACIVYLQGLEKKPEARESFYDLPSPSGGSRPADGACAIPLPHGGQVGHYLLTLRTMPAACLVPGVERLVAMIDSLEAGERKLDAYRGLLTWTVELQAFDASQYDEHGRLMYLASPIKRPADVLAMGPEFTMEQAQFYALYLQRLRFAHYNDDAAWILEALAFFNEYFRHQHGLEATCASLRELFPQFMLAASGRKQVKAIVNRCFAGARTEEVWLRALRTFLAAYPYLETQARQSNERRIWKTPDCDGLHPDIEFFRSLGKTSAADALLASELRTADIIVAEKLWLLGRRAEAQQIVDRQYTIDPRQTESDMQILYRLGYRPSTAQQAHMRQAFDAAHPVPEAEAGADGGVWKERREELWKQYWAEWERHFEQYPVRHCRKRSPT